jgi:hypothetical protein
VAAPPKKNDRGDLQRLPPLFTVLVGGDNHRYLQKKKHNKQSVLIFFSPFRIYSRVCFFCFGLLFFPLPVADLAVVEGATMVVCCCHPRGWWRGVLSGLRQRHRCWEEEMKERSGGTAGSGGLWGGRKGKSGPVYWLGLEDERK